RRAGAASLALDPAPVVAEHGGETLRRLDRSLRRHTHALQEESEPGLPVAFPPDEVEQRVVLLAVLLEVEAEVEQRIAQHAVVAEQKRDQEPADAAVAVEERMDRLELHVGEAGPDEVRQAVAPIVEEALERSHRVRDRGVRRRHEHGITRPGAADPVLGTPKLAGVLAAPPPAG